MPFFGTGMVFTALEMRRRAHGASRRSGDCKSTSDGALVATLFRRPLLVHRIYVAWVSVAAAISLTVSMPIPAADAWITERVGDVVNPFDLHVFRDNVYFADDPGGGVSRLYRTDGDSVNEIGELQRPNGKRYIDPGVEYGAFGDQLYVATDSLYKTDGDSLVPLRVEDTHLSGGSTMHSRFTPLAGLLYFAASTDRYGWELFKTDGSDVVLLADLNQDGDTFSRSAQAHFTKLHGELLFAGNAETVYGDHLYFTANGPVGQELYRTDGVDLQLMADINPDGDSFPNAFTIFGDELYFSARGPNGRELYKTDGTKVIELTDINPGGVRPRPRFSVFNDYVDGDSLFLNPPLTVLNGELYFPAVGTNGEIGLYRFTPVHEPPTLLLGLLAIAIISSRKRSR